MCTTRRGSASATISARIDLTVEPVQAPTVAEARAQGQLILVAEDDDVNQKVILRQLSVLGHAAEIAENGAEALRLWRTGTYRMLLTDLHMPEMDGYTLATTIRQEEAERGSARQGRMPILALTANALRGEALRAQAAGMDDYLTKPIQLHVLKAALKKWLPGDRGDALPRDVDAVRPSAPPGMPLDIAVLESVVGDDPMVVRDFLGQYQASAGRLATEARAALATDDVRRIGDVAHKLKSSSRSVGAVALGDLCAELENTCRAGTREGVAQVMKEFEAALQAADAQISQILASSDVT